MNTNQHDNSVSIIIANHSIPMKRWALNRFKMNSIRLTATTHSTFFNAYKRAEKLFLNHVNEESFRYTCMDVCIWVSKYFTRERMKVRVRGREKNNLQANTIVHTYAKMKEKNFFFLFAAPCFFHHRKNMKCLVRSRSWCYTNRNVQ